MTLRGGAAEDSSMKRIETALSLIDDAEVIQVTRDLVAIPSITRDEGSAMVDYYKKWFADLGIPERCYPYDESRSNFFADYGSTTGGGRFLFNGHQDTKPVTGMTIDPFAAEMRCGRIYGRGACDMKGGIAALLCAFKALVRTNFIPKGGITFFSDIEEEYSATGGYLWAKQEGLLDGYEGAISCEPSELEVQIGNRGCFVACFQTEGHSAHSGLAHLGVNAIHNMMRFIDDYLELPYLQVENPHFGKCTVNFEKIEGGLYPAAVPDRCVVCVDSRLIPDTPPRLVQHQVQQLMDRLNREPDFAVNECPEPNDWRVGAHKAKAEAIAIDHELVRRVSRAFEHALMKEVTIGGCPAMTAAMEFISIGIPAVICGPGSIAQAHTAEEWIDVEQLIHAARIYTALMAEM